MADPPHATTEREASTEGGGESPSTQLWSQLLRDILAEDLSLQQDIDGAASPQSLGSAAARDVTVPVSSKDRVSEQATATPEAKSCSHSESESSNLDVKEDVDGEEDTDLDFFGNKNFLAGVSSPSLEPGPELELEVQEDVQLAILDAEAALNAQLATLDAEASLDDFIFGVSSSPKPEPVLDPLDQLNVRNNAQLSTLDAEAFLTDIDDQEDEAKKLAAQQEAFESGCPNATLRIQQPDLYRQLLLALQNSPTSDSADHSSLLDTSWLIDIQWLGGSPRLPASPPQTDSPPRTDSPPQTDSAPQIDHTTFYDPCCETFSFVEAGEDDLLYCTNCHSIVDSHQAHVWIKNRASIEVQHEICSAAFERERHDSSIDDYFKMDFPVDNPYSDPFDSSSAADEEENDEGNDEGNYEHDENDEGSENGHGENYAIMSMKSFEAYFAVNHSCDYSPKQEPPKQSFKLMELPRELREWIYRYVVRSDKNIVPHLCDEHRPEKGRSRKADDGKAIRFHDDNQAEHDATYRLLAITRASKQVRAESLPIFYHTNIFATEMDTPTYFSHLKQLGRFHLVHKVDFTVSFLRGYFNSPITQVILRMLLQNFEAQNAFEKERLEKTSTWKGKMKETQYTEFHTDDPNVLKAHPQHIMGGLQANFLMLRMLSSTFDSDTGNGAGEYNRKLVLHVPHPEIFTVYNALNYFPAVCEGLGIQLCYVSDRAVDFVGHGFKLSWRQKYQKRDFDNSKDGAGETVSVEKLTERVKALFPDVDEVPRPNRTTYYRRRCKDNEIEWFSIDTAGGGIRPF